MEEKMIDVREAAKRLGCSERLVYDLMSDGRMPCVRIGRRRKIAESVLEAWMRGELQEPKKKEKKTSAK